MGIFTDSLSGGGTASSGGTVSRGIFSTDNTDAIEEDRYASKLASNKKAFAQSVQRLAQSGDLKTATRLIAESQGVFTPEEMKQFGLDKLDKLPAWQKNIDADGSAVGKVFRLGDKATGGALSKGLELLDKPSQTAKLVIGEALSGDFKGAGSAALQAVPRPGNLDAPLEYWTTNEQGRRIRASGLDENDDGRLENMREALPFTSRTQGGRWAGALDFAGEVLTDPTTYTSFGGGSLAKAGLRKVASEYGEDVAKQIAQRGLRGALKQGLRDAAGREITEDMLQAAIRETAQEAVTSEAARRATRRLVEKHGIEGAREILVKKQMQAVARSGRSGLRVGNPFTQNYRTVIPTHPGGVSLPGFAKYPWQVGGAAADVAEDAAPAARAVNPDGSIVGVAPPVRESLEGVDLTREVDRTAARVLPGDDIPNVGRVREVQGDTAIVDLNPNLLSPQENVADVIRAPQRTAAEALPFADETVDQRLTRMNPEDAISAVEAAKGVPRSGGFGEGFDRVLPRTPGVVVEPDEFGGGLIGLRDADGTLEGYLQYTDDAVGIFENISGRKGVGQELLDALEAQGVDVPALLANSEFTDAGRGSALKWLKGKTAAAPAAEAVDAFPPGSTLTAEGTETTFTVLGKTQDGQLVIQVDDAEALIPFRRTPPIKGNKTVQVDPNAAGAPDAPHRGRVVRRGQTNVAGIQRQDTIPGVGVVTAVDDEGRMFVRRPDVELAAPQGVSGQTGDLMNLPQRTVQEGLAFGDETADALSAATPPRQAAVQPGQEIPGVGTVQSVDGGRAVVRLEDQFFPTRGAEGFRFRQSRPVQEELLPEGQLGKAAAPPVTPPDVLRGGGRSAPVRRGLGGILRESKPGEVVRRAFVPRSGVRDAFGKNVADTLYENLEQAAASTGRNVNDMVVQIGKVTDKAARELKDGAGENLLRAMPELEGRTGYQAFNDMALAELEDRLPAGVREALAADGMENSVKALDAFADVSGRGAGALDAARGGVKPMEGLFKSTDPAPRILTKEGEKALKGNLALRDLLGIDTNQLRAGEDLSRFLDRATPEVERLAADAGGTRVTEAALPGTSYARMPVREANDELARRLNLPEGTKLFEDDAMAQVALRSRTAFEAASQTELYERLAKESFDGDNPMLTIVRSTDSPAVKAEKLQKARDLGWKKIESNTGKTPMIGDVYGPPEIVDEVAKVQDLIVNDVSMRRLSEFLTKWNGVWATQATVPLVFGTGFHSRNAIGNVINAFNGGLTNPARFGEAVRVQYAVGRARARMAKDGIPWEQALEREVKSPRVRRLVNDMRKHGIMSEGFFADLTADEVDSLLRHKSWKDWFSALDNEGKRQLSLRNVPNRLGDNWVTQSGRKVGMVVEDNARVALYLDHYAKTGSVQQAANQVKKFLFDYNDLTPFERRTMKAINRFYTFTRKNLAVQLYTLANDPWRIKTVVKAEQNMVRGEDTDKAALPEYARKGGFTLTSLLGADAAMNIETPMDAALEALDPIVNAISITPGLQAIVPPEYRSSGQEVAAGLFNFRSGGEQSMVNFLVEQVTGKDAFTGKDISEERGKATWDRFAKAISPLYAKGRRTVENVQGKNEMDLRMTLLQSLVGLSVLPLSDRTTNQVAYVGAQEAQNAIADLRERGIDVPTYSELVAAGLAPDLSAPKEETEGRWVDGVFVPGSGERRSPEEAAQARVDKINAARTALGASPIQPPKTERKRNAGIFG